jgi:hypothetical protein
VGVPAGTQRVEYEYAPWWDSVLAPVSRVLPALLLLWALVAAAALARRRA